MTEIVKTAWDKTAGYKTVTGAGLYLAFELFMMLFPNALSHGTEDWIGRFIDWLILTGVIDKAWRNKDLLTEAIKKAWRAMGKPVKWVSGLFKKKTNAKP